MTQSHLYKISVSNKLGRNVPVLLASVWAELRVQSVLMYLWWRGVKLGALNKIR